MRQLLFLALAASSACGGSDGSEVTVNAPFAPDATVAFRDGPGDWTVKPVVAGAAAFSLSSESYTVAIGCIQMGVPQVTAYELLAADTTEIDFDGSCAAYDTNISFHVTSSSQSMYGVSIDWGPDVAYAQSSGTAGTFMTKVASGTRDIAATDGYLFARNLVVQHDVTVTPSQTIDINFDTGAIPFTFMPSPALGVRGQAASAYVTAGGSVVGMGIASNAGDPLAVLDTASVPPGDFQAITYETSDFLDGGQLFRSVEGVSPTAKLDIVMPMQIEDIPDFEWTAGTTPLFSAEWAAHPELGIDAYEINVSFWRMYVSAGLFDDSPTFVQPDLSGVTGWDASLSFTQQNLTPGLGFTAIGTTPPTIKEAIRTTPHQERVRTSTGVSFSSLPAPTF